MRRFLPQSLAGQLIALLLAVLVIVQLATTLIIADDRRNAIQSAIREQLLERTSSLVTLLEEAPAEMRPLILASAGSRALRFEVVDEPPFEAGSEDDATGSMAAFLSEMIGDSREVRVRITSRTGDPIAWPPDPPRERRDRDRDRDRVEEDGRGPRDPEDAERRRDLRLLRSLPASQTVIRIAVPLTTGGWLDAVSRAQAPAGIRLATLVSTVILALGVVLVVAFMVRRMARPLNALADASDRFGRGETVALTESGPQEVRRTIHAFNTMQERIARFVADRTRMLAAISHDLRTPLTALRLRAEFVDDAETRDKLVEGIDELNRMAEATLAFSREEAVGEPARPTDLAALVRAVADDFCDLGHEVEVTAPDRLDGTVRPTALGRALRNLVGNAVRYGGAASVVLAALPGATEIVVTDDGPGIPEDRIEDMFEPFVRLEGSRSLDTGGSGLGLSIARSAVRAHGGELTLRNRSEGGLEARILLPTATGRAP